MGESGFDRKAKGAGSARRESAAGGTRAGGRPVKPASRPLVRPAIRPATPLQPQADAEPAPPPARMGWQEAINATVAGLGYELVDVERAQRGLLRITIDRIPGRVYTVGRGLNAVPDAGEAVTVEDCEAVTRQLQYVLEVEGLDYARLEVSSPGLDRPLKREADYLRFAGQAVRIALKTPFEGRKAWEGVLSQGEGEAWNLTFKNGKTEQVLGFTLQEVREARLVPVVDFKGRKTGVTPAEGADKAAAEAAPDIENDRGDSRDQG